MKKTLVILSVLFCLFGAVGCSKKEYKSEEYDGMIELINTLEELKEDVNEGVTVSYNISETLKGKYAVEIRLAFGDHELVMSTIMDSIADIQESLEDSDGYADWVFKVDGVEYDADTAVLIADHYYDTMYAD